jgi:hypothetical protein
MNRRELLKGALIGAAASGQTEAVAAAESPGAAAEIDEVHAAAIVPGDQVEESRLKRRALLAPERVRHGHLVLAAAGCVEPTDGLGEREVQRLV